MLPVPVGPAAEGRCDMFGRLPVLPKAVGPLAAIPPIALWFCAGNPPKGPVGFPGVPPTPEKAVGAVG